MTWNQHSERDGSRFIVAVDGHRPYGTNQTLSTKVSKKYNIIAPPKTRIVYTFTAIKHELNVPYIATVKGIKSERTFKIRGQWTGVDYTFTDLVLNRYDLNNPTRKVSTYTLAPINWIYYFV